MSIQVENSQITTKTLILDFDVLISSRDLHQKKLVLGKRRPTRWIKEAIHIRKEGHRAMNRDEGSNQLIHAYDRFLDATADCHMASRPSSSTSIFACHTS